MSTQADKVNAFFDSIPELKRHFTEAAKRSPAHSELLNQMVNCLDTLSTVPKKRAARTQEQQIASVFARQHFSRVVQYAERKGILSAEFAEMDKILAKNMKP